MPPKGSSIKTHQKQHKTDNAESESSDCKVASRPPSGPELTIIKELRAELASCRTAHEAEKKAMQRKLTQAKDTHAKLLQNEQSNRPQRRSTRSEEAIVREAQVNLVLRFQEQLSFGTMRRVRQASAAARDRTHSTGGGLSTHEDVGAAQLAACEEVWARGVRPISDLTGIPTDEGYYQDPVTVIQQYAQLQIELHKSERIELDESILDEKVPRLCD